MTTDNELLAAALDYAARGWAVLPLRPREKVPITSGGSRDATTDAEVLRGWWARWPDANVGIATGGAASPWVLDLDGADALPPGADLPPTAASTTGRGVHYLWAPDDRVRNRQRLWGRPADVRGAGGYIVAPPSVHPSGVAYEWRGGGASGQALARAPAWLLEAVLAPSRTDAPVQAPERPQAPPTPTGGGEDAALARWLRAAAGAACRRVSEAGEGGRHAAILREATALGGHDARLAAAGLREWARGELQAAGEAAGKGRAEVERAVRDGWAHGAGQPLPGPELRAAQAPPKAVPPPLPARTGGHPTAASGGQEGAATGHGGGTFAAQGGGRPGVIITGRDMADVVADVRAAIRAGGRLFQRAGMLVKVQGAEIVTVGAPELTAELVRACRLIRTRAPKRGEVSAGDEDGGPGLIQEPADRVPGYLLPAIMGAGEPWLPELERVVAAPYWRGGVLREAPGYYADDRLWLARGQAAASPTPRQPPAEALALLRQWLAGFPFEGEASFAHALAFALTPMLRAEIDAPVPMTWVVAPVQGTGKSLLAEVLGHVAGGCPVPASPLAAAEEERRKALVAMLSMGAPVVWLDNVGTRGSVDDPTLALAVTTGRVMDRQLGVSRVMTLTVAASIIATANNVELSRDIGRRSVIVRLDAGLDRPELRDAFAIADLRRWTRDHLPELREALYALVRAWVEAGQPQGTRTIGSFEVWARTIGGVLRVAGVDGFLDAPVRLGSDVDPMDLEWAALLGLMGTEPHTAAELAQLADREGLLGGVMGDGHDRSRATRLGFALRKARDRVFGLGGGQRRRLTATMRPGVRVPCWTAVDPDAPTAEGRVLEWRGPRPGGDDPF
jgi:hypothetical protein